MSAALAFAGASAGIQALSGLFGFMASQQMAAISESRGRMLRDEADADAERYRIQADNFKADQKLAYLKSGVTLEGSPLDVLDETARQATENINAIRSRGRAQQLDADAEGAATLAQGRGALIGGLAGGISSMARASYNSGKNQTAGDTSEKTGFGRAPRAYVHDSKGTRSVF